MKALVQRVSNARVSVEGKEVSGIGAGLLILIGIMTGDTEADCDYLIKKCANLRIFNDTAGVMNLSVRECEGDVLAVSQFTLAARTRKGNRPSYVDAAGHDLAVPLYERFCEGISRETGKECGRGIFGADMKVELTNDGPVTIMIDSREEKTGSGKS